MKCQSVKIDNLTPQKTKAIESYINDRGDVYCTVHKDSLYIVFPCFIMEDVLKPLLKEYKISLKDTDEVDVLVGWNLFAGNPKRMLNLYEICQKVKNFDKVSSYETFEEAYDFFTKYSKNNSESYPVTVLSQHFEEILPDGRTNNIGDYIKYVNIGVTAPM